MNYRKKYEKMRAARTRHRLNSPPPDYPKILPDRRKKIIITNYDFGEETHVLELYKSDRIDCYNVYVDGQLWKKRIGMSQILAGIRKAMPRVRRVN